MENCQLSEQVSNRGISGKAGDLSSEAVLNHFSAAFLDEEVCQKLLIELLHPEGPSCLLCGQPLESPAQVRAFAEFRRVQCHYCDRWFSATTGTMLAGSALDEKQTVLLAALAGTGVENPIIARLIGVSADTVRRWRARL